LKKERKGEKSSGHTYLDFEWSELRAPKREKGKEKKKEGGPFPVISTSFFKKKSERRKKRRGKKKQGMGERARRLWNSFLLNNRDSSAKGRKSRKEKGGRGEDIFRYANFLLSGFDARCARGGGGRGSSYLEAEVGTGKQGGESSSFCLLSPLSARSREREKKRRKGHTVLLSPRRAKLEGGGSCAILSARKGKVCMLDRAAKKEESKGGGEGEKKKRRGDDAVGFSVDDRGTGLLRGRRGKKKRFRARKRMRKKKKGRGKRSSSRVLRFPSPSRGLRGRKKKVLQERRGKRGGGKRRGRGERSRRHSNQCGNLSLHLAACHFGTSGEG